MKHVWRVGTAMVLAFAGAAFGQYNRNQPKDSSASKEPPKVMTRLSPHDWTLTATVNLRPYTETDVSSNMPKREKFDFTSAAVVFPVIGESASHLMNVAAKADALDGVLKLNDQKVLDNPSEILLDYPCGTKLAKWSMLKWTGEEVEIKLRIPVTSYETKYDEALANKLKWPESWPATAASALEPEVFIESGFDGPYDLTSLKDLIKTWTSGKDPKQSMGPAMLAKFLAGQVLGYVQPSGTGAQTNRLGELEGVVMQDVPTTIKNRRGSEIDMVALLVAAYRQVGIPSRMVFGWDMGTDADRKVFDRHRSSSLRVWAEFALADPAAPDAIWVPVDIVRMRRSSSRPQPLEREWQYFGSNKELDGVIPFAFQVFPPSRGVMSYGVPAWFGWMVTPKPPEKVIQTIRFDAISTPKRSDDMKKDDQKEKEKRKKNPYSR